MKRMSFSILVLLIALLFNAVPVFSEGEGDDDTAAARIKDECLLIAKDCGLSVLSIQDKIERLKEEIAKGTVVYTPEELKILKQKLDEVNKILDFTGSK